MRTTLLAAVVVASFLLPQPAAAQLAVQLRFDLPVVLPTLVVIEPGIRVVPHVNEEIFFVDGFYWVRRDTHWYRSHDHRRGWVQMERGVPPRLERIPRGHYRQWEPARGHHDRVERREDRREERKDDREQQRERNKKDDEHRREGDKKDREQRRERDKRD